MEEQNGSTEVWLGTHANTTIADQEGEHGDRASGRIKQDLLKKQKAVRGPCQPTVKKGSVIVRDLRLWHGGKPNLSDQPRVMLAFSMYPFCQSYTSDSLTCTSTLRTLVSQSNDGRVCRRAQGKADAGEDWVTSCCDICQERGYYEGLFESTLWERV